MRTDQTLQTIPIGDYVLLKKSGFSILQGEYTYYAISVFGIEKDAAFTTIEGALLFGMVTKTSVDDEATRVVVAEALLRATGLKD